MSATLNYLRLYADEAGVSHLAPPASPFSVSAVAPASRYGFLHVPSGWVGDRHPSLLRMWALVLSGQMEFEAGDGERHQLGSGSALLLEDTVGSGHRIRVIGNGAAVFAIVHVLAPQSGDRPQYRLTPPSSEQSPASR
jgi:hypothetical protein